MGNWKQLKMENHNRKAIKYKENENISQLVELG